MTQQKDKVSFLLDEYSGDAHAQSVLDEVESDVNLQYKMRRYQMIGEVIRHELPTHINSDFSTNVMTQIGQIENAAEMPGNRESNVRSPGKIAGRSVWSWSLMKPFAGMAVAASVAVVSITLWQSSNEAIIPGNTDDQIVAVDQQNLDSGLRWKVNNNAPALQQKLNAYLVSHTEYSSSMQGLIPQVRVVGFDAQR
jgi:negative regulator of sigma E activity